ncbi:hypothetical protein [Brevundimonas sp.]|uniref:hypothetical protein n=1 Tax=Brevundimonas sp. TaxID=1871086 RepID=UPI002C9E7726|nr:hypothetical protein [Brevundimonas sp.]HWQ85805.1 hypothetical protein [Brevundimonas sp.]
MNTDETIARLQKQLNRLQTITVAMGAGLAVVLVAGAARDPIQDEIKARRIALVDSRGVERVVLGEDSGRRHGRSAAVWIYDETGAERGGLGTFENGQASLALDAPAGVGATMPDRLGLVVSSTGAASVQLNNNDTGVPVRLVTDPGGGGGVELIEFDHAEKKARIRRLTYGDDTRREVSMGG